MMKRHLRLLLLVVCLLLAGSRAVLAQPLNTDPTKMGPHTVADGVIYFYGGAEYSKVFTPPELNGHPVELLGSVRFPKDLENGPYPLIFFLHGRHAWTYKGVVVSPNWPPDPAKGEKGIDSYRGYGYLADQLASYGYIVVSISANGINRYDEEAAVLTPEDLLLPASAGGHGMAARVALIDEHLKKWLDFNNGVGPFGDTFKGKVLMEDGKPVIGLMGHSRGGEAVVKYARENPSGAKIRAVLALAPTDFYRRVFTARPGVPLTDNLTNIPLAIFLPYADGDVNDLQGIHYFDDSRYDTDLTINDPNDTAPKYYFLVMGADHNFSNQIWSPGSGLPGSKDDWSGNTFFPNMKNDAALGSAGTLRLTEAEQRTVTLATASAFFRVHMRKAGEKPEEDGLIPLLKGDRRFPNTPKADRLYVTYHAPAAKRRDVNRFLVRDTTNANLPAATNTLGGAIDKKLLDVYLLAPITTQFHDLPAQPAFKQPHTGPSVERDVFTDLGEKKNRLGPNFLQVNWSNKSSLYYTELPFALSNVSAYATFQFRVGVDFSQTALNPPGMLQDIEIVFADGAGGSDRRTVSAAAINNPLFFPPGGKNAAGTALANVPAPRLILNTMRIPLKGLKVDFTNLQRIYFRFANPAKGALFLCDLTFCD